MLSIGDTLSLPRPDDSSWVSKLRSLPSASCPSEKSLVLFASEPLAVADDSYAHIVRGCDRCRG